MAMMMSVVSWRNGGISGIQRNSTGNKVLRRIVASGPSIQSSRILDADYPESSQTLAGGVRVLVVVLCNFEDACHGNTSLVIVTYSSPQQCRYGTPWKPFIGHFPDSREKAQAPQNEEDPCWPIVPTRLWLPLPRFSLSLPGALCLTPGTWYGMRYMIKMRCRGRTGWGLGLGRAPRKHPRKPFNRRDKSHRGGRRRDNCCW